MAKRITAGHSKYAQPYGRLPSGEYIYVQPNGEPLLDHHGLTEMVGDMHTLGAIVEMLTANAEQLRAALKEALDSMTEAVEVLTDEGMLNTADRFTAQIAELRKLVMP